MMSRQQQIEPESVALLERLAFEEFDETYTRYFDGDATAVDVALREKAVELASELRSDFAE
jgi:hypothetical protein